MSSNAAARTVRRWWCCTGGPGGGCSPGMRRFFDPRHYQSVLFDQRGCGRSVPNASVENNTTWDLVADVERIRVALGIERWIVFGGSWGACLALIYAQAHPERVEALVLRGIFTMTRAELDWFYGGGAGAFWPEQWQAFAQMVPEDERGDLIGAYHKRLFGPDPVEQGRFARAWAGWEWALAVLDPGEGRGYPSGSYALAFARLENHYFINGGFLARDDQVLAGMGAIARYPRLHRAGPLRHDLPAAHRPRGARAPGRSPCCTWSTLPGMRSPSRASPPSWSRSWTACAADRPARGGVAGRRNSTRWGRDGASARGATVMPLAAWTRSANAWISASPSVGSGRCP